ncbi:MAG: hypothetical protein ACI85I_001590 [Arenicella sp.]|jgi:hypothetical protein
MENHELSQLIASLKNGEIKQREDFIKSEIIYLNFDTKKGYFIRERMDTLVGSYHLTEEILEVELKEFLKKSDFMDWE